MIRVSVLAALSAATLLLGGCGSGTDKAELDKIDAKLGGKTGADPALSAALEDQIMVDPNLSGQANEDSIRPTNEPFAAPIPADPSGTGDAAEQTLGTLAEQQARVAKDKFNGCSLDVKYSVDFANRLPLELPLPQQARVAEAAGSDTEACRLRAVTYATTSAPTALISYYLTTARKAGYNVVQTREGSEALVSGTRDRDGAAFYAILQPAGSGTSVDLVANKGR
jgi:hypothetical protein